MKGKFAHSIPLTTKTKQLLDQVPRFERSDKEPENGAFIFTTTSGKRPVSGFSKAKTRVDRAVATLIAESRAKDTDPDNLPPWDIHDLRRTVRTRLSSLSVLPLVAELVIGHKQSGIHAVYDLHRYDAEKRTALLSWEEYLLKVVSPPPEPEETQCENHQINVVPLRGSHWA